MEQSPTLLEVRWRENMAQGLIKSFNFSFTCSVHQEHQLQLKKIVTQIFLNSDLQFRMFGKTFLKLTCQGKIHLLWVHMLNRSRRPFRFHKSLGTNVSISEYFLDFFFKSLILQISWKQNYCYHSPVFHWDRICWHCSLISPIVWWEITFDKWNFSVTNQISWQVSLDIFLIDF